MKKCPYCGYDNEEQDTNCKRCKAEILHGADDSDDSDEEISVKKRKLRSE